jgi:hypothetical protein
MTETIKNLTLAKNRLQAVVDSGFYPEIERDFKMATYGCYELLHIDELHKCRSVGCLIGNIALVLPILKSHFNEYDLFHYDLFGSHYFPDLYAEYGGDSAKWQYLFGINWEIIFPTFDHAIRRINHFINENGNVNFYHNYSILLP